MLSHFRAARGLGLGVAAAFAVMTGCATVESLHVPLAHRPTESLATARLAELPRDAKIHVGAVQDSRAEKEKIGENREDPKRTVPVFANGDPATHLRETLVSEFRKAGVVVVDSIPESTRVLKVELTRFWAEEAPGYRSEVVAKITIASQEGQVKWSNVVIGSAKRFGRSLSAENYQEVLSDAVIDLVNNFLGRADVAAALK